jgi:hypothetical protein
MQSQNDVGPSDAEVGLVDAITTIIEILLAMGVPPSVFSEALQFQRDAHRAAGRVNAAVVIGALIDCVNDPEKQRRRRMIQLTRMEPPKGTT